MLSLSNAQQPALAGKHESTWRPPQFVAASAIQKLSGR